MTTPYEYADANMRVSVDTTPGGVRLRLATEDGGLGAAAELSVQLTERLYMALGSALTRGQYRGRQ